MTIELRIVIHIADVFKSKINIEDEIEIALQEGLEDGDLFDELADEYDEDKINILYEYEPTELMEYIKYDVDDVYIDWDESSMEDDDVIIVKLPVEFKVKSALRRM